MTLLRDPDSRTRSFTSEWLLGAIGTIAVGAGVWMRYLLDSDLAEAWPFTAIIVGSLMLFAAFDRVAQKLTTPTGRPTTWVSLAALASLAAAVVFMLIWLL
ncbi:MAG: hypothetical protein ACFCVC_06670 [Acidimicrobiia bacterium]